MKTTPLYDSHLSLGAKMVPYAGFEMPVQYTSVIEEHLAVRENVGLFDVSHMGEFLIYGGKASDFLQWVTSNDITKLVDGQAQYSCLPNEEGGIIDDIIVYRKKEQEYMMVVNAANIEKDWNWLQQVNKSFGAELENVSDSMSLLALQGPKALKTLAKITDLELEAVPFYHFTTGKVADFENVIVSNTGYTGAGGFELYMPNEQAVAIWDALISAGQALDITPCGLAARDTLRLEKGYCLYGNDIDETTTPLEAGLGWITKLQTEFIAKKSLQSQKEEGVRKKLIAFKVDEVGIPRKGYEITNKVGDVIGKVTSGTQSPILKKGIGLGYVTIENANIGESIFLTIRNKNVASTICKLPFV